MQHHHRSLVEYGWRRLLVTLAVSLATMLEIVDSTIVNVALPTIQGNLGATIDEAAWVVTGYIVANVVVISLTPWLQARFGRKQYYTASIVGFTLASVLCGLSGSFAELVFWRIVQGIFGGGLISTSQAILQETYPPEEIGKGQGIFALGVVVGPTIGPALGGFITDQLSWRWVFFINIVPGVLAALLTLWLLRNPEQPRRLPVDVAGIALLAAGIGSLQYVLEEGERKNWFADGGIMFFTALAVLGLLAFVVWELRYAEHPVVDLTILKNRGVAAGSLLGMTLGISLYGSILILPQFVQSILGFTATLSGYLIMIRAAAIGLLTPVAALLVMRGKLDMRWVIGGAFVLVGVGNFMQAAVTTTSTGFWEFAPMLIVGGIGLSQLFVPLSVAIFASAPPRDTPKVSAFFNLARQLGGSIATAVLVTILDRREAFHYAALASDATLHRLPVSQYLAHASPLALYDLISHQAQTMAFADTALWTAIISIALAPLVILMRRPRGGMPAMLGE
ncbi:DHA2 family efflux MFS transporter permease subunit [bacterium]|nr:MAG: DHA2 family efflux MFS transporter permease subunit [bacterium]